MLRYILHDESPTGKCGRCGGNGMVTRVNEEFFTEGKVLTKTCVKFLQNSTNYKEAAKVLNSDYGLSITKPLDKMDMDERQALFWGWPTPLKSSGKPLIWPGIIAAFLRDHRHYSDPMADTIYAGRRKEICPICRGKLLRPEYQPLRILGVNYGDLLTKPVEELSQIMKAHSNALPAEEKIFSALSLMVKAGLGDLMLSQTLAQLEGCQAALVRWISMYVNRTADIGIVAASWDQLDQNAMSFLKKTAKDWQKTNPVWFI